jgi:sugar lactone lactonase YvrE
MLSTFVFQTAICRFRFAVFACMPLAAFPTGLVAQQGVFTGATSTVIAGASLSPIGVAVDASGNVFFVDAATSSVMKAPAGGGSPVTVVSGLHSPQGVAVDAADDVFVVQAGGGGSVVEIPIDGTAYGPQILVASGLTEPSGVAVDASGNVFFANNFGGYVLEVPNNEYGSKLVPIGSGFKNPTGVTLDAAGNLYVVDSGNNRVEVLFPAPDYGVQTTLVTGLNAPWGIAIDAVKNLFIADSGKNQVLEAPFTGTGVGYNGTTTVPLSVNAPNGLAIDSHGSLLVGDAGNHRVNELAFQSVNFGNVNVCPAGQPTPVPCTKTITLNFDVTPFPIGLGVAALTLGAENLDFTFDAADSNCTGDAQSGETCSVDVTFAPLATGQRQGVVEVFDGATGDTLATVPVYGTGTGAQIAFADSTQIAIGSGLRYPAAVAIDGAENVYVADTQNDRVVEFPAGGGNPIQIGSGMKSPYGVAVDGAGNVFIADSHNNRIVRVPAGGGTQTTVGSGFNEPDGVAVDSAGNVFVADSLHDQIERVAAGSGTQTTLYSGLAHPQGVAVDGAGNLFIADTLDNRVLRVSAGGARIDSVASGLLGLSTSVAVDAAGDVFIADYGNSRVVEVLAGTGDLDTVGVGFISPYGVAVDGAGNVFVADTFATNVFEVPRAAPPTLSFALTNVGSTSADSPQTVGIMNIGNEPLVFSAPASGSNPSYAANFPENGSDERLCASGTPVVVGGICDVSMSFAPSVGGAITGSVVLTDNALNQKSARQTIVLKGSGTQATPAITWGTPAPIALGTALGAAQLDAASPVAGTFTYTPASGTVLALGAHKLSVTFKPTNPVNYTTATASVTIWVSSVIKIAPRVTWATPAAIKYGAALSGTQLKATASVPGTFAYSPAAGTVLGAGAHVLTTTFTPKDGVNYASKTATVTLAVTPALLTVTAANASVAYGKAMPALTYTVAGFVNKDTVAVLSGKPVETTTAKTGSPVGSYPISISDGTLKAANYTFAFRPGKLTITSLGTAAKPAFTPGAGIFKGAQSVTIADKTTGAVIHYTTNGAMPTAASTKYTGAVTVKATETIKAFAIAPGYANSAVATAKFTIQ